MNEYNAAAYLIQDYYDQNSPIIALYHDILSYAVSNRYSNYVTDSTFGINNVNTFLSIKRK